MAFMFDIAVEEGCLQFLRYRVGIIQGFRAFEDVTFPPVFVLPALG